MLPFWIAASLRICRGVAQLTCCGLLAASFTYLATAAPAPFQDGQWLDQHETIDQVRASFGEPPIFFAPHAFWFWNDELNPKLAGDMAAEMVKQRFNPGYTHARYGLPEKQWLSPLWFESLEEVRKGLEPGFTFGVADEYWWPSGRVGTRMLKERPQFHAQTLTYEVLSATQQREITIPACAFATAARLEDDLIDSDSLRVVSQGEATSWRPSQGDWKIYVYQINRVENTRYVNYLLPGLVEAFIEMAYEPYEQAMGPHIGEQLAGFFIDNEGDYGLNMAWSEYLPQRYQEMTDRDIRRWMPLMTDEDKQGLYVRARCDWFEVVSDLYNQGFWKPLNDWLQERNAYCISNFWEGGLPWQAEKVGDFFEAQRAFSMPGNDALFLSGMNSHHFKETQSVCELENRPFMSEIMGVQGWMQTPVEMKQVANGIITWGVSHVVPHGINLHRDLAETIHPADWFIDNPYWEFLHLWNDFVRRAAFLNRQGRAVADIAVYCPMKSVWAESGGYFDPRKTWSDRAEAIDSIYQESFQALTNAYWGNLTLDDHYLEEASVEQLSHPNELGVKTVLRIRDHVLSAVVLPPATVMPRSVSEVLTEFATKGGLVFLLGDLPTGSPSQGANDPAVRKLMARLRAQQSCIDLSTEVAPIDALLERLPDVLNSPVTVGNQDLLITQRRLRGANFYWVANNTDAPVKENILLRDASGAGEIWNCENGSIMPANVRATGAGTQLSINLKPYEAFWVVFPDNASLEPGATAKPSSPKTVSVLSGTWMVSLDEGTHVQATLGQGKLMPGHPAPGHSIASEYEGWSWQLLTESGFRAPWTARFVETSPANGKSYFVADFNLASSPAQGVLSITAEDTYALWVNGKQLPQGPHIKEWRDVDAFDLDGLLKRGNNRIAVEVTAPEFVDTGHSSQRFTTWLALEAHIELQDGQEVLVATPEDFLWSDSIRPGWMNPDAEDGDWAQTRKQVVSVWTWRHTVREPVVKIPESMQKVWYKIPVPPGATAVSLPGLSPNSTIWVDEARLEFPGNPLQLPANSEMLLISVDGGLAALSAPAEFVCSGSVPKPLEPWFEYGLARYSGVVNYDTRFMAPEGDADSRVILDLGELSYVAEVFLNGQSAGKRMWPPFAFDITEHLRSGENQLRVRVGNLIVNEVARQLETGRDVSFYQNKDDFIPLEAANSGFFGPAQLKILE